jgi:hypothetical protein
MFFSKKIDKNLKVVHNKTFVKDRAIFCFFCVDKKSDFNKKFISTLQDSLGTRSYKKISTDFNFKGHGNDTVFSIFLWNGSTQDPVMKLKNI